jgi:trk system potassium uptake protein TrkA
MKIVIVGGGKVGYYLAKTLASDKNQLVLIEEDLILCRKIVGELNELGVEVVHGDGTDISYLKDAEIEKADILIAVTGYDQSNLVACQLAKNYFSVPRTIARVNNPKNIHVFKKLGVDSVVSSTALIAEILELEIDWSCINEMLFTHAGQVRIKEVAVTSGSTADGRQIADLALPEGTILISIVRNGEVIIPNGQTRLQSGDHVITLTHTDSMDALFRIFK